MKQLSAKDSFTARIDDMCRLAEKRGTPVFSAFLNDREQFEAHRLLDGRHGFVSVFWGGNDACTRKMLRISAHNGSFAADSDAAGTDDFPVFALSLSFRKEYRPEHKDFLGSFMALGIERETVGDIFIGDDAAAVFCTGTARDMIRDNISRIGRVGVTVTDGLNGSAAAAIVPDRFSVITLNVASERADCIVSGITGLSRDKSAAYIRSGSFLLNYDECCDVSRNTAPGDVLTLRGHGKFIVDGIASVTKKGRLRLTLKKYV